jgi:hypothetical protein
MGCHVLPEAKKDIGDYLMGATTSTDSTSSTVTSLPLWLKKNGNHCPDSLDHHTVHRCCLLPACRSVIA